MPNRKALRSSRNNPHTNGRIIKADASSDLQLLNQHAAGIDIGAQRHYVAVPPDTDAHPVREFSVFTKDL